MATAKAVGEEEFSAERAARHVQAIAREAHPVGSAAHRQVRQYLLDNLLRASLKPSVQSVSVVTRDRHGTVLVARAQNVVARLRGSGNGQRAVLLAAHYDSEIGSPGAADNGAAVASLLETARTLAAAPPLRNDIVFLFSDAHEPGLFGARGFVAEHPWARDVALVLNFDARGTGGPVIMFEASSGTERLLEELAEAAPYPVAASFSEYVYRTLPNSTDFTVFTEAGWPGLNFAFLDRSFAYHTALDRPEALDLRSLQHQGSYALGLARHFGGRDLEGLRGGPEAVYFSLPGRTLAVYPAGWSVLLGVAALLAAVAAIALGRSQGRLTLGRTLGGLLVWAVAVALVAVLISLSERLLFAKGISYRALATDHGDLFHLAFALLASALAAAAFLLAVRRLGAENTVAGGMLIWGLLALASGFALPLGSYLFVWPALFAAAGLAFWMGRRPAVEDGWVVPLVLALCAVPAILLWAPTGALLAAALESRSFAYTGVLAALLCVLLAPLAVRRRPGRGAWLSAAGLLVAGLALLVVGVQQSQFDAEHPGPSSILYVLDSGDGEAAWVSFDPVPTAWSSQFLTGGPSRKPMGDLLRVAQPVRHQRQAPRVEGLRPPELEVLSGVPAPGGGRILRLRVRSQRSAPVLQVRLGPALAVRSLRVAGRPVPLAAGGVEPSPLTILGFGLDELDVEIEAAPQPRLEVDLVDRSFGLPRVPGTAFASRPREEMPNPYVPTDSTFVRRAFVL